MILRNAVEIIKEVFPSLSGGFVQFYLNNEYKKFCRLTRLLKEEFILPTTTSLEYSLPIDTFAISEVIFKNLDGSFPATNETPLYEIKDTGNIRFYSRCGTITEFPSTLTVTIRYIKSPAYLSNLSDEFEIQDEYCQAIISGVLANLYTMYPTQEYAISENRIAKTIDWKSVNNHKNIYNLAVLDAKRQSNIGFDGTSYDIQTENLGEE